MLVLARRCRRRQGGWPCWGASFPSPKSKGQPYPEKGLSAICTLAIPAKLYVIPGLDGKVKVLDISLGKVSVVQIARAVVSQESCVESRLLCAARIPGRILLIGRGWPITPVDITSVPLVSLWLVAVLKQVSTAAAML